MWRGRQLQLALSSSMPGAIRYIMAAPARKLTVRMRCFRPEACMPTSSIARSARFKRFSPLRCAYASRGCMMCPTPRCDKPWTVAPTPGVCTTQHTFCRFDARMPRHHQCVAGGAPHRSGHRATRRHLQLWFAQPSLHLRYRARSCSFPCRCRAPRGRSTGACLCRRTTGTQLVHEFEAHRAVWTYLPRHDYRTEDSAPPRRISRNEAPTCESQPCTAYAERKIPTFYRGAPIRAGRAP